MRNALLFLAVLMTVACSHGRTASFPTAADPDQMRQVVVIRNDNLFGWGISVNVTFNEVVIARLRAGEHVAFPAAPGLHTVGVTERGIYASTNTASSNYIFQIDGNRVLIEAKAKSGNYTFAKNLLVQTPGFNLVSEDVQNNMVTMVPHIKPYEP